MTPEEEAKRQLALEATRTAHMLALCKQAFPSMDWGVSFNRVRGYTTPPRNERFPIVCEISPGYVYWWTIQLGMNREDNPFAQGSSTVSAEQAVQGMVQALKDLQTDIASALQTRSPKPGSDTTRGPEHG